VLGEEGRGVLSFRYCSLLGTISPMANITRSDNAQDRHCSIVEYRVISSENVGEVFVPRNGQGNYSK